MAIWILGLVSMIVTAWAPSARAEGLRVVNSDIAQPVKPDTAPTNAPPLQPMRLVAPRNGTVSGQVLLVPAAPLTAATATCSDLKSAAGAVIPSQGLRVAYPTVLSDLVAGPKAYTGRNDIPLRNNPYFDALSPALVPGTTVQPVVLTVRVPRDATPGDYTGTLTLQTSAGNAEVPVALTVSSYLLPAPRDYTMWLSFNSSPETIAIRYGDAVPPAKPDGPAPAHRALPVYGDEHIRYQEASFRLLGELGNHVLYVPVIEGSHLGFRQGLIRFREEGGKLTPDFGAFDRVYAAYAKHCGTPRVLVLMIWEGWMNGHKGRYDISKVELTVVDAAGNPTTKQVTAYPGYPDWWTATLKAILEHMASLKIPPEAVHWGTALDWHPTAEQVAFLKTVWRQGDRGRSNHRPAGREDRVQQDGKDLGEQIARNRASQAGPVCLDDVAVRPVKETKK